MFCPECGEACDIDDVCKHCGVCDTCCECEFDSDAMDSVFGFDSDEFGEDPEAEYDRRFNK